MLLSVSVFDKKLLKITVRLHSKSFIVIKTQICEHYWKLLVRINTRNTPCACHHRI